MHRFTARIGSAVAIFVLLATGYVRAESVSYAFDRSSITFTHVTRSADGVAVGSADPGLARLLHALGATMTWHSGERQVLISTAAPEVIGFAVGDPHYTIGAVTGQARFAPQFSGDEVYLPFDDLMHALGIAVQSGVLERLITGIDVQGYGNQAVIIARGAGVLRARVTGDGDRLTFIFSGVGTTLSGVRSVNVAGIRSMEIAASGSARDPQTTVTLALDPLTRHDPPQFGSGEFEIAFGANGSVPPLVQPLAQRVVAQQQAPAAAAPPLSPPPSDMNAALATAPPSPVSTAGPIAGAATVNGAAVKHNDDGSATVTIDVTGNAQYEWHRLRAPDNRFWVDISNATLAGTSRDEDESNPLLSLRMRQIDPKTVRVALSFSGDNALAVSPSATGLIVNVRTDIVADGPREGDGSIGAVVSANEPQTAVTPVPADEYGMNSTAVSGDDSDWKFSPRSSYVPLNPKLIVLDPGHGGSDRGSIHGDLTEAVLNLDISKRVRTLLVAKGWQVQMTRETDVDVYQPNDSARDELQTRDNLANHAGARIFVSIHCNAYLNAGPNGTTIYYSKPSDVALAQALDRALDASNLGTKDDGTIKSKFWVTLHANMPAALIETAFESNPSDAAKLDSPAWRQQIAEAIANGIDAYAQSHPVAGSAQ